MRKGPARLIEGLGSGSAKRWLRSDPGGETGEELPHSSGRKLSGVFGGGREAAGFGFYGGGDFGVGHGGDLAGVTAGEPNGQGGTTGDGWGAAAGLERGALDDAALDGGGQPENVAAGKVLAIHDESGRIK